MQVGRHRLLEGIEHAGDAPLQANDVCRGRIGPGAELVEVAAGAEGSALAAQLDPCDLRIGSDKRERFDERVPHRCVECVEPTGPSEGDGEAIVHPIHPDSVTVVLLQSGRVSGAPCREFRPGLQDRVGGRLGHQALAHGRPRPSLPPEQEGQCDSGDRVRRHVGLNPFECIVAIGNGHVAQVEPTAVDCPAGDADHDEGQAGQGVLRPIPRSWDPFMEGDLHRAAALGREIALQLEEQTFGAEGFEDRETLPCPRGGLPGRALGRQRRHGAHRVP